MLNINKERDMEMLKIDRSHKDAGKLLDIYERSFPDSERIESDKYYDMLEEYSVDIYGIYEEEVLVGLLNIMTRLENRIVYFWFFAVDEKYRNRGIGGKALEKLISMYPDCQLVLDMEPLKEGAGNYEERLMRTRFYERYGFSRTGRCMTYFGNTFEIMCTKAPFREGDFRKMYDEPMFKEWQPVFADVDDI